MPTPRSANPLWSSIPEAAAAWKVSYKHIRRMIERGDIYAERLGSRIIRVDLNSVQGTPLQPESAA